MKVRHGFTLIELLMVIAIIGIISTLAVNKVGSVREASARKVSLANQVAVGRAVESFLASGGRLNRLDSLVSGQGGGTPREWRHAGVETSETGGYGFDCSYTNYTADAREIYLGPTLPLPGSSVAAATYRADDNAGLTPGLQAVLCPYELKPGMAGALDARLGLRYVMEHNDYAGDPATAYSGVPCADGSYVESVGNNGRDANESGCLVVAVTNGMALFAVNPVVERGRAIYRACGQDLLRERRDGETYGESEAVRQVYETGGPLLAFGLGERCSAIGKSNAGLESAPFATYPMRKYYARYIVLIRLRTIGGQCVPEFAGVIDPCGHTVRAARDIIANL